jgi:nucleoside 2-deoxyribosyltransferase
MNIYLCSRIAKDAHEVNEAVAKALSADGHNVFIPHRMHYNQIMEGAENTVTDEEIYTQDMNAMYLADICVVVGKVGVDCSFEMGWFQGRGIHVYHYKPYGPAYARHPMWYNIPTYTTIASVVAVVNFNETRD